MLEYLIEHWGFQKIHKSLSQDEMVDVDKFDLILRIHEIHYLFYSEVYKAFTIGVKHEHPKGVPGTKGKINDWTTIMLPKIIYTTIDADNLLNGLLK